MGRPPNARQLGGFIGAVGGLVFVLANAGGLPGAWLLRAAAVAAFAIVVLLLVLRPPDPPPQPSPGAVRIYWACVAGEVAAIPLGAAVLRALDRAEAVPAWVVLVVGLHFLPFASAFQVVTFRWLGLVLTGIAAVGIAATFAGSEDAAPVAAVVAGFALFAAVLAGRRATD